MANVKITDLPAVGTLAVSDVLPIVDTDQSTTKKATVQQVVDLVPASVASHGLADAAYHTSSTLAELNSKISDATLDDASDPRTDNNAIHDNTSGEISAITAKGTPVANDYLIIEDSAAANAKKAVRWGTITGSGGGLSAHGFADNTYHTASTLAEVNNLISDATLIDTADSRLSDDRDPNLHGLGNSARHSASTLAELNALVSDATLIDTADSRLSDDRDPNLHGLGNAARHSASTLAELNALVSDATLDTNTASRPAAAHGFADVVRHTASTLAEVNTLISDATLYEWENDLGGTQIHTNNVPDGADATAIHDNVSGEIAAITAKATPVANDYLIIEDSAAANAKKHIRLGSLTGSSLAGGSDNTITRWDGTTNVQSSSVFIDDSGHIYPLTSSQTSGLDGKEWDKVWTKAIGNSSGAIAVQNGMTVSAGQLSANNGMYVNGVTTFAGNVQPSNSTNRQLGVTGTPWYRFWVKETLFEEIAEPATPAATKGALYTSASVPGIFFKNSAGQVYNLTSGSGGSGTVLGTGSAGQVTFFESANTITGSQKYKWNDAAGLLVSGAINLSGNLYFHTSSANRTSITFDASANNLEFYREGTRKFYLDSTHIVVDDDFRPVSDTNFDVGSPSFGFRTLYIANITTPTSETKIEVRKGLHITGSSYISGSSPEGGLNVSGAAGSNLIILSASATVNTDASLGNVFQLTLTSSCTLANPTNLKSGYTYMWILKQDLTGSRTLSFGTSFKFPGGTAPTLSTATSSIDVISAVYDGAALLTTTQNDFS